MLLHIEQYVRAEEPSPVTPGTLMLLSGFSRLPF
jgi:hypothetical protein